MRIDGRTAGVWIVLASVVAGACSSEQLGFPRTPAAAVSPDGRFMASVHNHPNLDPPSQSIWFGVIGLPQTRLQTLAPDADWCNLIVWSSDSSTVSYLIQDVRLVTVDARSATIISTKRLTDWKGEYPPYRIVRNLSLSSDGREALFQDCERRVTRPGYQHEAIDCGPMQRMAIR
jgi:hypothetical protein